MMNDWKSIQGYIFIVTTEFFSCASQNSVIDYCNSKSINKHQNLVFWESDNMLEYSHKRWD